MPGSLSVDRFVKSALTIEPRLNAAVKAGVFQAALAVTESVRQELPSSGRLRGVGRRGAKIGVGFNIVGATNPVALVAARGPVHLIERDTAAHQITVRGRGAAALSTPAGPRRSVQHPGTTGQHPFEHGVARAVPVAEEIIRRTTFAAYAEAFKL
jgi:hypothetical protein